MNKKLAILIFSGILLAGLVIFLKSGSLGTVMLWNLSNGGKWLLPLVMVAALIDSINPCAFSVLLLTIAFLFSVGKLRSDIVKIGGVFIFGIFVAYLLIGFGILQVLHIFNTPHFMAKVGALLLIALGGINLANQFLPAFPIKLHLPRVAHNKMAQLMEKASLPTAFLLGGLVGLCEFPCTGGPYLMVLGLLYDQATYLKGAGYLILYNIIFVLPLIIILSLASNEVLFEKVKSWQKEKRVLMKLGGGIAMIGLGIIILLL